MIFIGTDLVFIPRFLSWLTYSDVQLLRIFTPAELARFYHIKGHYKDERSFQKRASAYLASRFAVKEAVYKACCAFLAHQKHTLSEQVRSFFHSARFIETHYYEGNSVPHVVVRYEHFFKSSQSVFSVHHHQWSLSLSHEHEYAMATAVLQLFSLPHIPSTAFTKK